MKRNRFGWSVSADKDTLLVFRGGNSVLLLRVEEIHRHTLGEVLHLLEGSVNEKEILIVSH